MRLDMSILDQQYQKWAEEDESLSGVLNNKLTRQNNADLRLKMGQWKIRKNERKIVKKRNFDNGKSLREWFQLRLQDFSHDKQGINDCIQTFNEFSEDSIYTAKNNLVINDYIVQLPDASHHTV